MLEPSDLVGLVSLAWVLCGEGLEADSRVWATFKLELTALSGATMDTGIDFIEFRYRDRKQ